MGWYEFKHGLELWSGLDMDALHVHAGVMAQLLAALVLRRSLRSPWPWLAVAAATLANEYYDLTYEIWPERDAQWAESVRDGWNTMLLPTLLLLIARFLPRLLTGKPVATAPGAPG